MAPPSSAAGAGEAPFFPPPDDDDEEEGGVGPFFPMGQAVVVCGVGWVDGSIMDQSSKQAAAGNRSDR